MTSEVLHPRKGLIIVMESAIYASKIRPASVYAARPAPPPSLSERLESLSAGGEGGEAPPRPPADVDERRADGRMARQPLPAFEAPQHEDAPVVVENDAFAQQLAQSLREHFM